MGGEGAAICSAMFPECLLCAGHCLTFTLGLWGCNSSSLHFMAQRGKVTCSKSHSWEDRSQDSNPGCQTPLAFFFSLYHLSLSITGVSELPPVEKINLPFFFFFFWSCIACGILVPQPEIKPAPLPWKHWTTRKVPHHLFLNGLWAKSHFYNFKWWWGWGRNKNILWFVKMI